MPAPEKSSPFSIFLFAYFYPLFLVQSPNFSYLAKAK